MPELNVLLESDVTVAFSHQRTDVGLDFDAWHAHNDPPGFHEAYRALVRATPSFGYYDALLPEPAQRNRSLLWSDLQVLTGKVTSRVSQALLPRFGLPQPDQVRVLICDGPALLAFVGGLRNRRRYLPRHRAALGALVPSLQRRLRLQLAFDEADMRRAAFDAALDEVPAAAFVVKGGGYVEHANAAGRAMLARDRRAVMDALLKATRGLPSVLPFTVTQVTSRGRGARWLAIAAVDERGRVANVAKRWGLTPRQTEVIALLAHGHANKTIASILGCDVRTVENHVAAILARAQVKNRAGLVAAIWALA